MSLIRADTIVTIGTRVVAKTMRGNVRSFIIVEGMGYPDRGIISHEAPLARACLGHAEGDEVMFFHNRRKVMVTILAVV